MKAKKENKVYNITELQKSAYLKEGYDIYSDKGEILEYSPKKTITYNEHIAEMKKLETTNTELTKQNEELTEKVNELTKQVKELTKK